MVFYCVTKFLTRTHDLAAMQMHSSTLHDKPPKAKDRRGWNKFTNTLSTPQATPQGTLAARGSDT